MRTDDESGPAPGQADAAPSSTGGPLPAPEKGRADRLPPIKAICFIFDSNIGGPTIRARSVYARLAASGHSVRIAFPHGDGPAPDFVAAAGVPVDRLPIAKPVLPRKPWAFAKFAARFPFDLWRTAAYLRARRPDLIHVNGAFDVGPALAGWLTGTPVVWHLNDTVFSPRLSRLLGRLVRRVATVIVVAAGRVGTHYGVAGAETVTIHAPVDVDRFVIRNPEGRPYGAAVIGQLASWNWIKGQDRFIEAVKRLRAAGRPVRGRIVGAFLPRQRDYWQPIVARMEREGLGEHIDTPGFAEDSAKELAGMDLMLLTSHSEASPMCVLEGMSVGVPQVVFDVGGVREMLGEGADAAGIIVPEGDIDAMVMAVGRLLDDPVLYARMAAAGQARARAHFSLEACVARHEAAYRQAIATKRGSE